MYLLNFRQNCQVAIYVNVNLAIKEGLKFYRSSNNVILCPGNESGFLDPKYFLRADDLREGLKFKSIFLK